MDLHYVQDSEEDSTPKRSSRKKGKTTERIVWSGSPVYTEDEDKFYHAVKIDNINYYLKEHIQLPQSIAEDILKNSKSQSTKRQTRSQAKGSSNSSLPSNCVFIGNIKRLWENSDNIKMCEISNIWASPDVTPEGRRPHHGAKELVKFDQLDELTKPLNDLFPKTHISSLKRVLESFEEFSQRKDFPDEVYFVHQEKLLEPKIEAASPAKRRIRKVHTDSDNENDENENENETQNETQKEKRDSSSSSSKSNTHSNRTEEPGSNDTFDDLPTSGLPMPSPSPSKRKNMRMISDEDDYIVVKQEESLDENGDRPLRRLKRNRKIFDDEEEEETSTIVEPEDETPKQLSTPKRRRRIIADSDDDEIFTNEPDPEPEPEPTRRSTRIPSLQQQKHEKVRRIVSNKRSTLGEEDNEDESNNNDETQDSSEEFNDKTAEDEKENNSVDLTEDDVTPSKPSPPKTHNNKNNNNNNNSHNKSPPSDNNKTASKRDMSWIEMSEKGKLAAPGAKHSLLFDKPKSTNFDLNKRMKRGKQADIKSFMTEQRGGPEFVHLVDEDDGDDDAKEKRKSNSASVQNKSKRTESEKKRGSKEKPKSAAFIPQLMFDDNDVDNDMRRHLKQQMLQHDLSRYSNTNEETRETRGRWGHSKRRAPSPTDMDDDSDNADNDSGYESDDFLVADDAPIETYAPSQDELDDGLEESDDGEKDNKEEDDNDEFEDDDLNDRNDQDGLFNHVFTNKQAFIVFLQYIISSCADDDFIPMMVDAEHQDTYFKPALRKIRDQIASRKASLVQSSAWEENFKEDLENRVYYASWEAQNPNLEDCHACLRANHPASFKLCLSGPVYNPEKYMTGNNVLELPVLPDKDREDYEEADEVNYLLGRFCHKRTSLYHRLHFFHVHMYERVKKKVEHQCHVETEELVQSLLDNTSWITEMSDIFTNLLLEADDFMNDSHEIM